jgi:hypothetical protein
MGKKYQITTKYTQWFQNIPNGFKIYQTASKYTKRLQNIPNGFKICIPIRRKLGEMSIKYTNNFHCTALQNLPKLGVLV